MAGPKKKTIESSKSSRRRDIEPDLDIPTAGPASSSAQQRHVGLDNCKRIFMFLVVVHHMSSLNTVYEYLVQDSDNFDDAKHRYAYFVVRYRKWIEKIAVPGFSFLSGYFGKGFLAQDDSPEGHLKEATRWKRTTSLLLLAPLLWQLLHFVLGRISTRLMGDEWIQKPYASWDQLETWYLYALLLWRIFTTVFVRHLRYPLATSILVAWMVAISTLGDPKDLRMRIFFFFPYYVAGLYTDDTTFQSIIQWCQTCGSYILQRCCCLSYFTGQQVRRDEQTTREFWTDDVIARCLGCFGMSMSLMIFCFVDSARGYLGWQMQIESVTDARMQLVFFLHYLFAGIGVLSFVLFFQTIQVPLFPFGHSYSTLVIFEWHWYFVNYLKVGVVAYSSGVHRPFGPDKNLSFVYYLYSELSWGAGLILHVVAYVICLFLGSKFLWDECRFKYICDPVWLYRLLFLAGDQTTDTVKHAKSPTEDKTSESANIDASATELDLDFAAAPGDFSKTSIFATCSQLTNDCPPTCEEEEI